MDLPCVIVIVCKYLMIFLFCFLCIREYIFEYCFGMYTKILFLDLTTVIADMYSECRSLLNLSSKHSFYVVFAGKCC